ncbi:MAG: hypothetical protein ACOYON_05810 [Fimbriimonas sp.]
MRFAWQGFGLDHPEDWAPLSLQGDRNEGYVRIASAGKISFQVRWKHQKPPDNLEGALGAYRDRLAKDARKRKIPFEFDSERQGERSVYRYSGGDHGRGALFFSQPCSRVFFVEAVAPRRESILGPFRTLLESFISYGDRPAEWWSLFGLEVQLPAGLKIRNPMLQAGRTMIEGDGPRVGLRAERWAFGAELLRRHALPDWATSVLQMRQPEIIEENGGLRLREHRAFLRAPVEAIVRYEEDRNQLITIRCSTRQPNWRPQWDWLRS